MLQEFEICSSLTLSNAVGVVCMWLYLLLLIYILFWRICGEIWIHVAAIILTQQNVFNLDSSKKKHLWIPDEMRPLFTFLCEDTKEATYKLFDFEWVNKSEHNFFFFSELDADRAWFILYALQIGTFFKCFANNFFPNEAEMPSHFFYLFNYLKS